MILCVGTTPTVQRTMTFASLQIDAVNRAASVHEYASGKSINVARVAHTLGEAVVATGFLGGDAGRFIRSDLERAGIAHDFIEVETATRLCITVIDQANRTATELIEESMPVAREAYGQLLEKIAAHLPHARAMVLSGTLPPGAPQRFYADCVTLAGGAVPVIVDAKGEPLDRALECRPTVAKPNRAELGLTLDADVDDDDALRGAMRQMIGRGAQWVVVTAGRSATLATNGKEFWRIEPPSVEAVSPIGSGDAFAAGLALGLVRGMEIPQACSLGTACGAANALTPYAGHVDRGNVERLAKEIHPFPCPLPESGERE